MKNSAVNKSISVNEINALIKYLQKQPYEQVFHLINMIMGLKDVPKEPSKE